MGSSKHLSINQQLLFLESMTSLLQNGFSIKEAMAFISQLRSNHNNEIRKILDNLQLGLSFASSINAYFPDDIVNQVQIAERHGNLTQTLIEIKLFIEMRSKQQNKIKSLLMYPIFLLLLLSIIIIGIRMFVVPQLSNPSEQPVGTHNNWYLWMILLGVVIVIFTIISWYWQLSKIKQVTILSRLPLVGIIFQSYYAYYLASNISLLLASGLEAQSIAQVLKHFKPDTIFNALGKELETAIQTGGSISTIIYRHAFIANELALFFDHGDQASDIAKKLSSYSQLAFKKMWNRSQKLIAIIQPTIFILIGGIIVATYLNMLLPMYDTLSEVYN